ncbi:CDP-glycerol--glycerophosphate glycerophosphotransferase [Clostridium botulinum]|nr:CDP-glycerol--glycerophosphate glycerophosphotransferase [Clostridium botulinum]
MILNNIFITAAYFNFKKEVKVMQVWHAIGTFKKFGEDYEPSIKINNLQKRANRIYTEVVVCSEKDRLIYSKAFNVDINKTKSLGSPICDLFQDDNKKQEIKQKIYNKYSKLKQKKIYLYAPTFRDTEEDNLKILSYVEQIGKSLDENTILILRLHPHIYKKILYNKMIDNVIDMSNYDDVNELMIISDVLITDYSSLFYEYSYLEKPIIFFAFDLKDYENKRGFYYNYIDYVPGEIIFTIEELISRINQNSLVNKSKEFKEQYFDYRDGNSCERIVENLLK